MSKRQNNKEKNKESKISDKEAKNEEQEVINNKAEKDEEQEVVNNRENKKDSIKSGDNKKTEKSTKRKEKLSRAKRKTVNFVRLLWQCMTYKLIFFVIAFAYGIFVFSGFRVNVQNEINENTKTFLLSIVNESLEKVEMKINDEFVVLETMAFFYDKDIELDITQSMYDEMMENHTFEGVCIIDNNKNEIVKSGEVKTDDDEFIDSVLEGNDSISAIYMDKNNNELISLAVPIYIDNENSNGTADENGDNRDIAGALICSYNIQQFTNIIDTSTFEQIGTTIISQEDGTLVSRPESINSTNLFNFLDSININNEKSIEKLKKSITSGQTGIITYGKGKHKRYICYNVVPDTRWYSVSIVSTDSIEPVAKKVSRLAVNFIIHMCFVVVVYFLITFGIDINAIRKNRNKNNS